MKKLFCDKCKNETTEKANTVSDDGNFEVRAEGGKVLLVIAQPREDKIHHYDDLCIDCFFTIFSKYDTRPRCA